MNEFVISGTWLYQERQQQPYVYLPFTMPEGVECLNVSYHSSLLSSRGVEHVDIGVFDERGYDHGSSGFRGWSGSARQHFYISENAATPGYVPGPLRSGQWHIVLGTESKEEADINYEVTVQLSDSDVDQEDKNRTALFSERVLEEGARYFRGDLHCHTVDSDGSHVLPDVVERAIDRGLDFLAITNHNVLVNEAPLEASALDRFLLLGGEEVTTYRGHLNVWGLHDWIDFRVHDDAGMQRVVDEAVARGCVTSINHPKTGGPEWEYACLPGIGCMEVWGAPWVINNEESLALYDRLLADGHRLTAVGGSDIHVINTEETPHPYELGNPTTHVYAPELSERAVLLGMTDGRVSITADPSLPPVELWAESGSNRAVMGSGLESSTDTWRITVHVAGYLDQCLAVFIDGALWKQTTVNEECMTLSCPAPQTYVRVEILREACDELRDRFATALSNPVYCDAA